MLHKFITKKIHNVVFTIPSQMSWKFLINAIIGSMGPEEHEERFYKIRWRILHLRVLAMLYDSF